jgi:NhaC family Na+:H+ antiporter
MLDSPPREPSLWQAALPMLFLIGTLALSVYLFRDNASYGPNQIGLLLASGIAAIIGLRNGITWKYIEAATVHGIALAGNAILILLAVGALIGTWILSGTVPTLIDYGLWLMHPSYFYPATCFVCALVALAIGSSWTVAGTLGVSLIGVASGLEMSPAITAGAIISGAYFGDKLSPLSDTTNMAPAAAGGELFAHVRHMVWTTVPSIALALLGFALIGLMSAPPVGSQTGLADLSSAMHGQFALGVHLLIPLLVVFALAMRRVPAYPTILIGALLGAVFAVLFQPDMVVRLANNAELSRPLALLAGAWTALFDGFKLSSDHAALNELLSRGGMAKMMNTIWLVVCAMSFGAVMERTGLLERMIRSVLKAARSTGSLIVATLATALGVNITCADQYLAIVLTGRIYRPEYERRGLAPENLSRALEDAGTVTSPLIPWNSCGAYMAATLGVATLDYLPYAFFNLVNPIIAGLFAWLGYKILHVQPQPVLVKREF